MYVDTINKWHCYCEKFCPYASSETLRRLQCTDSWVFSALPKFIRSYWTSENRKKHKGPSQGSTLAGDEWRHSFERNTPSLTKQCKSHRCESQCYDGVGFRWWGYLVGLWWPFVSNSVVFFLASGCFLFVTPTSDPCALRLRRFFPPFLKPCAIRRFLFLKKIPLL